LYKKGSKTSCGKKCRFLFPEILLRLPLYMKHSWKILLPLFTGTVVMIFVLQKQGSALRTESTPLGIVSLEFAKTTEEADAVLQSWQPNTNENLIQTAKTNIWLDFIFIIFYSLFLFAACKKIRYHSQQWQKKAGKNFANGALVAGGLDVIENIFMLQTIYGEYGMFSTLFTFICAAIKFSLAALAVLYILLGINRLFRSRRY
jgi:hypothetical protein